MLKVNMLSLRSKMKIAQTKVRELSNGMINNEKSKDSNTKDESKDVVILHQFPRAIRAPSASPFPIKLETWIRMTGINYKNKFSMKLSPKGKVPWIEYNGVLVSDSQLCIEFLMKTFHKDLSAHLSPTERAIARAFLKLNEESARWAGMYFRFSAGGPDDCGIPEPLFSSLGKRMMEETYAMGYGRHSKEEIFEIGKADLKAIEDFIGNKKYLMGNKICNEDASIFGLMCQLVYHDRGPFNKLLLKDFPNIIRYVAQIKQEYWPDWENCIQRPKSSKS